MGTYDLKKLAKECIEELNAIGIYPTVTPNDFSINTRAKSRFGQCKYKRNGYNSDGSKHYDCSINISSFLLDTRNDVDSVKSTIHHEILHSLNECIGEHHGGKWKEYAELVSDCYAKYDITRCSTFEERLDKDVCNELVKKNKSYSWKCSACGSKITVNRARAPKWYMHPKGYIHKNCPCGKGYVMSEYYGYKLI